MEINVAAASVIGREMKHHADVLHHLFGDPRLSEVFTLSIPPKVIRGGNCGERAINWRLHGPRRFPPGSLLLGG